MSDCSTHAGDVVREARVKGTEPGAWGEKASGEATTASILFDFVFVWRRRPCEGGELGETFLGTQDRRNRAKPAPVHPVVLRPWPPWL
jgi:hypothetical protein